MTADVVSPALLDEITASVRAVPGIGDAVAVVRHGVRAAGPDPAPRRGHAPAAEPAASPGQAAAYLDGGPVDIPAGTPATLQEALRRAADTAPGKGTIFIRQGRDDELQTYSALRRQAERVLGGLRAAGLEPGDAALFQFADNQNYLTAFWACVLGGFIPTPVAVAPGYQAPNEVNRKLRSAWNLLGRPVLITEAATAGTLAQVRDLWDEPGVRIVTTEELATHRPDTAWYESGPDFPVLNLLTSGSTSTPKCVQHTNASVTARSLATIAHCGLSQDDVGLIWMPFDHVTVAFYNVRDVFLRCLHVNAKIEHFLADPLLWLDWANRYRATNTWAPNFAFALVNEHAEQIRARSGWDLSCLREMVNAGEPVIASTSHRFLELLAPHGLPADAMCPVWGMSETCSGVTYTRQSRDDRAAGTVTIDPDSLSGIIREVSPADEHAVVLSTVGRPIPGVQIRVVREDGSVLSEHQLGELRIRGRTMMREYVANPEANRECRDAEGWFRTGDLAFVHNGEVVIAGRKKDQIIVRGINYLAHEIENVVERVDGVRVTFSAAVGVREPGSESDQIVIFFTPERWEAGALTATAEAVRAILVREVGLAPDLLVPVTETEFPKTGSGKIQRAALVAGLRAGKFADRAIQSGPDGRPASRLCRRQWVAAPVAARARRAAGVRLVVAEPGELGYLGLDGDVVVARRGDGFCEEAPGRFRLTVSDREQVSRLLSAVTARHGEISSIVFALPLAPGDGPGARLTALTAEFCSLVSALAGGEYGRPRLLVLTAGSVHVREGDRTDLGTCALPGLVRTAITEVAPLPVQQLDLPADRGDWARAVRAELDCGERTGIAAIRQGSRLEPRLCPVEPDEADAAEPPVTAGGLYLVTGGLGGIAREITSYLLASYGVRLLLVGRSPASGERAGRLAELAALGEVVYHQLDVADADALQAAVSSAEARWGRPLDGVLHLAGADPTGQWASLEQHTIASESPATFAAQYRAKVTGTLALAALLRDRPQASLILFGSVNGEFGGHSFGAYSAASSFLVGFAESWHHEQHRRVQVLAWSRWAGVGMNRAQPAEPSERRGFATIEPDDGLRLFLSAAALPDPYLLIGLDLANPAIVGELVPDRLRVSEVVVAYTAGSAEPAAVRTAAEPATLRCPVPVRLVEVPRIPTGAAGAVDAGQLLMDTAAGRRRRAFSPPATDLEREIALIWSDALNRPGIGRDDSFFELGGNSLRATRLLAMVSDKLAVRLGTQELYENPTVAGMAAAITRNEPGPGQATGSPLSGQQSLR